MSVRVLGVKETIKELKAIDPEIRKSFNRNVKAIVEPAITAAQQKYRAEPYPSGTARKWKNKFPLDGSKAAQGTQVSIRTARKNRSTILILNKNAGASVFEFANTGSLGEAFRGKNGAPARTLWPSVNANMAKIINGMRELIDEVTITVARRIAASGRLAK